MIFSEDSIKKIVSGEKVQTRRLVKEGENGWTWSYWVKGKGYNVKGMKPSKGIEAVGKNKRVKWQVGSKYSVCSGRGKPQVWFCPNCRKLRQDIDCAMNGVGKLHCTACLSEEETVETELIPLFIEITGIRKEKLLDISEADAEKEGFDCKGDFYLTYSQINKKVFEKYCQSKDLTYSNKNEYWSPEVWVIDFRRVD